MSPPLVAMATAPHVADRRRKRRGRGVEDKRVKREWKEKGGKRREDWKKNRTGQEGWGKEAKGREGGCKERRRGDKGEKSRTFLFTSHSDSRCFLKSCFPSIKLKLFCRCGDIGLLSGNTWKYLQAHQSSAAKKLLLDSRKFRRLKILFKQNYLHGQCSVFFPNLTLIGF